MSPRADATYSALARMETTKERFSVLMVGVWRDHIAIQGGVDDYRSHFEESSRRRLGILVGTYQAHRFSAELMNIKAGKREEPDNAHALV